MSATRLDNLRQEAYAATRGLAAGQQALVDALRDLQLEKGRAADGYRAVVQSLAAALEARDGYTSGHSDEVQRLAVAVAERLGLSDDERAEVQAVAILHDIGKIGIPDRILHKPGKLTEEDWVLMRQHPVIGERILRPVPGLAGAARAVRHEHERWDGGGYPDGLAADAIPLASRIVLACDAWHAMVSDRPYRRALDRDGARDEMRTCAGSQFDPQVVVVLLACLDAPAFAGPPPDWTGGAGGGAVAAEMLTLERELRALLTIAASVAGADELHDVLDLIADEALGAMGADSLSISRWEAAGEHLRTLLNAGELGGLEERRPAAEIYRLAPDDGLRRSLLEGRPYLGSLDDPDLHPLERELLESTGKHSCAAVPIMFAGQPWGEMWVTRRAGRPVFGAHDVRFLQAIAAQVATAIGRAEMFTRMAALAMRDELTGLANRRALDERLELVVEAALRGKGSVTLVLCDLDRLKELNDIQGHEAGDAALRRTADVLTELVASQPRALVARLGGDEMCLLLEGVEATEAQELAEMALARLGAGEPPLGLSCGIAAVRLGIESPSDLLRAADSALYVAKRSGRGRVCVADNHPRRAWRDGAPRQNGRRALRDHGDLDVAALLTDALQDLDGPMAARPTVERLGSLAMACAAAVDATAAGISLQRAGEPDLHTLLSFDRRSGQTGGVATHAQEERYVVADYPGTEALLEHGGSVLWRAADPAVDPAELALLAEWGYAAVLAVSARGSEGAWLLEIYADELTGDLASLEPLARVLAVHGVHGGTPEARSRSRAIRAAARADTLA